MQARSCLVRLCAVVLAFLAAPALYAQSRTEFDLDLPSQSLAASLRAVGSQTSTNVLFDPPLVEGRDAPALKAELTADLAFERLLAGTGLEHRFIDDKTVVVAAAEGAAAEDAAGSAEEEGGPDSGNVGTTSAMERMAQASGERNKATEEAKEENQRSVSEQAEDFKMEEIVVTGSHIRGMQVSASPKIEITLADIEKTGYMSIEAVMRDVPQNFASISADSQYGRGSLLSRTNQDRASGVDLRGLGAGSTLTLLNGIRRAGAVSGQVVDISAIPLSAIEKMEIVTGGKSATYGSDAVGGVVNFITRKDFQGAESRISYGAATGYPGGDRLNVGQLAGFRSGRTGVVASYEYTREDALNIVDTGLVVSPRPLDGAIPLHRDIQPDSTRHAGLLSGEVTLSDGIHLSGDALYTHKEYTDRVSDLRVGSTTPSTGATSHDSDQYSASGTARIGFGGDWELKASATRSVVDNNPRAMLENHTGAFAFAVALDVQDKSTLGLASAVADGPLFQIGGITPRVAIGVDMRTEKLTKVTALRVGLPGSLGTPILTSFAKDRDVWAAFGEMNVLLGEMSGSGDHHQVELSLAARYDHYEDFGGTFNPQVGIVWRAAESVSMRAAFSTAFRAPALFELGNNMNGVSLVNRPDPTKGGALVPVLVWSGSNQDLTPEDASTWSAGVSFTPPSLPSLKMSLDYFDIEYKDRLDSVSLDLERESRYTQLINRNPTVAELEGIIATNSSAALFNETGIPFDQTTQNLLDVFPDLIVFDSRTQNIAVEKVRGIDLIADMSFDRPIGVLNFGLNLNYTVDHDRRVTENSPDFSIQNEVGKPVDLRARLDAGWSREAVGAYIYVNYTSSYSNQFQVPVGTIDSWTTVDATFRYSKPRNDGAGLFSGFTVTLGIQNIFDNDPPAFANNLLGLRYDTTNASPIGRFATLKVATRW